MSPLQHVTGENPVVIVEGDTDRIFMESLRNNESPEPDYIQLGGVNNLERLFGLLLKSSKLNVLPSVKIIVDSDNVANRWRAIQELLSSGDLEEGILNTIDRSEIKDNLEGSMKVGAFLLRGNDANSPDLEGLISDSIDADFIECRNCLNDNLPEAHGYSKRIRFVERACNVRDLRDVSYHSLYGRDSDINFDSRIFQPLRNFLLSI